MIESPYKTGRQIYEELKRLEEERLEINSAVNSVYDEVGENSIAYTILKDTLKERDSKILKLKAVKYRVE